MRVQLVRSWPHRCERMEVDVDAGARIADALAATGWGPDGEFVALAVFGQPASLDILLHEGDRIELLRRLRVDPKQARRLRATKA
ncbi:MAG: RnfH family protein [Thermomonas sp.]|uniref:RnfH family protein n=1 Tax=Thermomonas sp. TaxID=1971895 RepID=UPI00260996C0|nr:RnfH family protein [Thermomonas sp.]MCC7095879.1 RnfH family protein [Thermomonas sp.]